MFGTDDNSFNVTSTLIVKKQHAFFVNIGFTASTAKEIADYIRNNELQLEGIFILHGDPDYYFGLEQIIRTFPGVIAYSTKETAMHIAETIIEKMNVWSGQLKEEAPDNVILPKIHEEKTIDMNNNFKKITAAVIAIAALQLTAFAESAPHVFTDIGESTQAEALISAVNNGLFYG